MNRHPMDAPAARRFAWSALALVLTLLAAPPLAAQHAAAPADAVRAPRVLDARQRAEVLEALLAELEERYVEADTARMIAEQVRARARSGAYERLSDPAAFATAVTTDLRKLNGDLHLSLSFDPAGSGPLTGGMGRRVVAGGPGPGGPGGGPQGPGRAEGPGVRRIVTAAPPAGPVAGGGAPPPFARAARESNFGLTKLEILPGNVGYLEISGFLGVEGSDEAVAAAMRLLERTDAVILDVRRNGGGSGLMSHLVFSHFLPAEPVETIRVESRDPQLSRLQTSLAEVPGPRRPDVPLYVLTSRNTGSAAEEFAFVLKNLKRATVVGDRTAGAGHMVAGVPMPHGFVAGVSITRVSDPRTGAEWEAVGVQPDRNVPADQALGTAHAMALRAAAATAADEDRRRTLERTAEWVEARDRPRELDPARLAAIAGRYEGDRIVQIVSGRAMLKRGANGMADELVPLADGSFALGGATRVRFGDGSPSSLMTLDRADGSRGAYPRLESSVRD